MKIRPSPFLSGIRVKTLGPHKYGCLMALLPSVISDQLVKWCRGVIPDYCLTAEGRETQPHITVKYGFKDSSLTTVAGIRAMCLRHGPFKIKLDKELTLFKGNKDGEVLKCGVEGKELRALNKAVAEEFPCEDKYPDYNPHITFAYLKPEFAHCYEKVQPPFIGQEVEITHLEWSGSDGHKEVIPLCLPTGPESLESLMAKAYTPKEGDRVEHLGDENPEMFPPNTRGRVVSGSRGRRSTTVHWDDSDLGTVEPIEYLKPEPRGESAPPSGGGGSSKDLSWLNSSLGGALVPPAEFSLLRKRVRRKRLEKAYTEDLGRRVEGRYIGDETSYDGLGNAAKRRRLAHRADYERLGIHSPPQGHPASMVPGQPEYEEGAKSQEYSSTGHPKFPRGQRVRVDDFGGELREGKVVGHDTDNSHWVRYPNGELTVHPENTISPTGEPSKSYPKKGFTGAREDKLGRLRCYSNGKPVFCQRKMGSQQRKKAKRRGESLLGEKVVRALKSHQMMELAKSKWALAAGKLGSLLQHVPTTVRTPVGNLYHATHAVLMSLNHATQALAKEVCRGKGLTDKEVENLSRVMGVVDLTFQGSMMAGAFATMAKDPKLAATMKLMSYCPVASAAFLVGNFHHPVILAQSAYKLLREKFPSQIKGAASFLWGAIRHPLTPTRHKGLSWDETLERGRLIAEGFASSPDKEKWLALFCVAFDDTRDVKESVKMADACTGKKSPENYPLASGVKGFTVPPSPFLGAKSLFEVAEFKATPVKFSGRKRDRLGHWRCYSQGNQVACKTDQGDTSKGRRRVDEEEEEGTYKLKDTVRQIEKMRASGEVTDEDVRLLGLDISGHSLQQLHELRKKLGIQATGKKHEIAKRIAEAALRGGQEGGTEQQPTTGQRGSGGAGVREEDAGTGGAVAEETQRPGGEGAGAQGDAGDQSSDREAAARIPASLGEINKRVDKFTNFFRAKGNHHAAEWMEMLKSHVNAVGGEEALKALGPPQGSEVKPGGREDQVQYWGVGTEMDNWRNMGDFMEAYLSRNGIFTVTSDTSEPDMPLVSALGKPDRYVAGQDFKPEGMHFTDKLTEAKHLPGLEKSEDVQKLMGREVTHLTDDVVRRMDEVYGEGQWIIKCYDDNAAAGYGIFFPQRVKAIKQDAQNTIWAAGEQVAKHGFELKRGPDNKVVGIRHKGGDEYDFGSDHYENTIFGDVRHWADRAAAAGDSEQGAILPEGSFMAQPAFQAVGISDAERAEGKTWHESNEGRVHLVTKPDGKVEVIPHSTWLKGGSLPVVFEDDDTRAMAEAAKKAIEAVPHEARKGQVYAPDVMKTPEGYRVVELNAQGDNNGSGYLHDNHFTIDAYTSYLSGREPQHVAFIRKLLTKNKNAKPKTSKNGNEPFRIVSSEKDLDPGEEYHKMANAPEWQQLAEDWYSRSQENPVNRGTAHEHGVENAVNTRTMKKNRAEQREYNRRVRAAKKVERKIPKDDTSPSDPLLREDAEKGFRQLRSEIRWRVKMASIRRGWNPEDDYPSPPPQGERPFWENGSHSGDGGEKRNRLAREVKRRGAGAKRRAGQTERETAEGKFRDDTDPRDPLLREDAE